MTGKQKAFADQVLANPTKPKKKIIMDVYDVTIERAAEVMASENLRKPAIMAYLDKHAVVAEETLYDIMQDSRSKSKTFSKEGAAYAGVAVTAAKDILDRIHGKATQRIESRSESVIIGIDLSGYAEPKD